MATFLFLSFSSLFFFSLFFDEMKARSTNGYESMDKHGGLYWGSLSLFLSLFFYTLSLLSVFPLSFVLSFFFFGAFMEFLALHLDIPPLWLVGNSPLNFFIHDFIYLLYTTGYYFVCY